MAQVAEMQILEIEFFACACKSRANACGFILEDEIRTIPIPGKDFIHRVNYRSSNINQAKQKGTGLVVSLLVRRQGFSDI